MKVLLTGAAGMLGREVADVLHQRGHETTDPTIEDLDITEASACRDAVPGHDAVVNCAAWTAVDAAEEHEGEAFAVNAVGAANLAAVAAAAGARLVQVSTDYVFDGRASAPYRESDLPRPRSAYGRTKAAGEWAVLAASPRHLVVRTAWLYGNGPCFPRTIARLLAERPTIEVVDDQRGQPTWSRDVADVIGRLLVTDEAAGVYHATASGEVSWHGFAQAVAVSTGRDPATVTAVSSDRYPRPAPRPAYSVLEGPRLGAAGIPPIGDWRSRWVAAAGDVVPLVA